jgi:TolA-binding protein
MGYEAKLKNAKLSYYKGDFKLAQSHLDVLKLATSREIANDAMDLSLLIQDNIGLDSTEEALREYAKVDLLLFQNKKEQAVKSLEEMKVKFANHTIIDEILFLEGKLYAETGNFERAITNFETIYKNYPDEIYADDALFLVGKIYDENLNQSEKALEIYTTHLKSYPGSIYTSEVRKKLRKLRGDNIN